jgi:hypothetical protein
MKKLGAILPVFVALGILAALAVAGNSNVPSSLSVDTSGSITAGTDTSIYIAGHVESKKNRCLPNRRVKVTGKYDTESVKRPFDVARTSGLGGYDAIGPNKHAGNDITSAQLTLKPKVIGPKHHRKTCGGDQSSIKGG